MRSRTPLQTGTLDATAADRVSGSDSTSQRSDYRLAWRGAWPLAGDIDDVGVFLGLNVGKSAHHERGLTLVGKKVFDKQLPNSKPKLRAIFGRLAAKFGTVLVIVDQPATIGACP